MAKVTGGAASKLNKIKTVRRDIARILTVYNQTQKAAMREATKGQKYQPFDLRAKRTRAIRRRLSASEVSLVDALFFCVSWCDECAICVLRPRSKPCLVLHTLWGVISVCSLRAESFGWDSWRGVSHQ